MANILNVTISNHYAEPDTAIMLALVREANPAIKSIELNISDDGEPPVAIDLPTADNTYLDVYSAVVSFVKYMNNNTDYIAFKSRNAARKRIIDNLGLWERATPETLTVKVPLNMNLGDNVTSIIREAIPEFNTPDSEFFKDEATKIYNEYLRPAITMSVEDFVDDKEEWAFIAGSDEETATINVHELLTNLRFNFLEVLGDAYVRQYQGLPEPDESYEYVNRINQIAKDVAELSDDYLDATFDALIYQSYPDSPSRLEVIKLFESFDPQNKRWFLNWSLSKKG